MTEQERKKEIADKLSVLLTAYEAGEIKIYRVARYQNKPAPLGHKIIRIKYISDNKIVYDGAYFLKIAADDLMSEQQLTNFILLQLATQL